MFFKKKREQSPCSKCIVFPMCKERCQPFNIFLDTTEYLDHYARVIFQRTTNLGSIFEVQSTGIVIKGLIYE